MSVKISELPSLETLADNDILAGVDTSEDTTSKITLEKIKNYATEDVYDKEEVDDTIDALQAQIDSLSTIYNAFPSVSDEGESMTLDDTAEVTFKKLDLKGNTSQVQYTGKNYLPITLTANGTLNGISYSYDKNTDWITINGTATATTNFVWDFDNVVLPSTTYVQYENTFSTPNAQILYFNGSTQIAGLTFNGLNRIYDLSSSLGGKTINRCSLYIANGTTITNGKFRPMITQYSTQQTYEPYVGGTASPNPSYPSPVNVVSGDNTIDIVGKNLLDNSILELFNSNKYVKTPDYNIKGTIKVQPNTTYTLSSQNISFTDINVYEFDENNNITTLVKHTITQQHSFWFTTSATAKTISFYSNNNGLEMPSNLDFQIEVGNQASNFEPYIGNSYPLYLGVLGKNLFTSEVEQGAINANAGSTYANAKSSNATRIRTTNLIRLDKTKSYTISCKTGYNVVLQAFNDNQLLYIVDGTTNTWVSSKTFTNIPYIAIAIRKNDNSNITPSEINNAEVMLEVGTSASTYEAPNPIELCKIGTYQDYIYKDNGSWYLHKEIGKIVLDGSETWNYYSVAQGNLFRSTDAITDDTTTDNKYVPYCNYYTGLAYYYVANRQNNNIYIASDANNLDILDSRYTDANDFKTWLSTHNTLVYYALATPTNTLIEDTTLIEQLEELKLANSYEGQTNISQENNDKPFILDVEAIKKLS